MKGEAIMIASVFVGMGALAVAVLKQGRDERRAAMTGRCMTCGSSVLPILSGQCLECRRYDDD